MDVVRSNFLELLPKLRDDIRSCDFIAIDSELSGLGQNGNSYFDTLEERYLKIKSSITQYLLIQYGLSCFTKSPTDDATYTCSTYNFYIFPYKVPGTTTSKDKSFLCQSSSLTFLSGHDFDFNKWIREGISYLNVDEETSLMESLKGKNVSLNTTAADLDSTVRSLNESNCQLVNTNHVPDEHKEFIEKFMAGLNSFVSDESRSKWNTEPCSSFRRKLIFQSVESLNFASLKCSSCTVSENSSDRYISIEKITTEQKTSEEKKIADEAVGFSRVIQELIDSKKPVVGHNLLLDMIQTIHHFIGDLPGTLIDFKEMLSELFPNTFDTKLMAKFDSKLDSKFQNTALNDLYKTVQKYPFPNIKVEIVNKLETGDKGNFHNAAYDSYVTGVIFLNMVHYLYPKSQDKIAEIPDLVKFRGKYNLTFSFDISYLDINDDQQISERFNVFHLTFPSHWTRSEIYDLLSPFRPGQIGWINDTSALIALDGVSGIKDIDRVLRVQSNSCTIKSYRAFMENKSSPITVFNSGKRKLSQLENEKLIETSTPVIKKTKVSPTSGDDKTEREIFDDIDNW